ncbi:MAG: glycosyltransferase family 87 protein [Anaeroplasma sp.]
MKKIMSKKVIFLTYSLMFLLSILFFILIINSSNSNFFSKFFFQNGSDRFMDYLNSIRDAKDKYVYDEQWVIYPPFINCLFFLISKTLPKDMVYLDFTNRYLMQTNIPCLISMILFFTICFIVLWTIIQVRFKDNKIFATILFLSFLISMPMLWAIERGNVIILCTICLIGFISFYNHDNKYYREIAYVLLAVSVAIKIYPILFIVLILCDRRYKEFVRTLIYIIILFLVPFVFYDGFYGMSYLIRNILNFSSKESTMINAYATSLKGFLARFEINTSFFVEICFDILLLTIGYFNKKRWIKVCMLTFIILNLSSSQIRYNSLYFLIPIVALLCEKDFEIIDLISIILLAATIFLNPYELSFITKYDNLLWPIQIFYIMIQIIIISCISFVMRVIHLKKDDNLKSILYLC